MPTTPCAAAPGYFCSPLYNRQVVCPENWYCAGGDEPARKCLEGRWSAVASAYPEDCVGHWTVQFAVLFVLFFSLIFVFVCIWYARGDMYAMREGSFPDYGPNHEAMPHGTRHGPNVVLFVTPPSRHRV